MKTKELLQAIRHLQRFLADPRVGADNRKALQAAERELKRIRRSGKLDKRRIFRATALISETLCEALDLHEVEEGREATPAKRQPR